MSQNTPKSARNDAGADRPTRLSASGTRQPNLAAYHAAFLVAALLMVLAAGIALAISDRDAAASMQRQTGQLRDKDQSDQTTFVEAGV